MYCPNCGKPVPDGAKFCGECGCSVPAQSGGERPDTGGKKPEKKPGKHKKQRRWLLLLILVVLVLALLIGLGAWMLLRDDADGSTDSDDEILTEETQDEDMQTEDTPAADDDLLSDEEAEALAENYTAVNDLVVELASDEAWEQADTEGRAEQLLQLLADLEEAGQIQADSIDYDEDTQIIWYEYAVGGTGGGMLEDFADGVDGAADGDNYNAEAVKDAWSPAENSVRFAADGYPAVEYPYEEADLSALIIYDLGYDYVLEFLQEEQEVWSSEYLDTDLVEEATAEDMRTLLSGYDLVVVREHGILHNGSPLICMGETVPFYTGFSSDLGIEYAVTETGKLYLQDTQEDRILLLYTTDGQYHTCLAPEFFEYYYGDNGLTDAIVWLGICDGYSDDSLVSAFADCGAKAVISSTESVNTLYGTLMCDTFVYMLLYGNMVSDSLSFAQSIWGENDQVFTETYILSTDTTPAEFRYYNEADAVLVTLTLNAQLALVEMEEDSQLDLYVQDADGNRISDAVVTLTAADGSVCEITQTADDSGDTFWSASLPDGDYTLEITADGYEDYSEEITVSADVAMWICTLTAEVDALALYADILDQFYYGLASNWEGYSVDELLDYYMAISGDETLFNMGFALIDLDDDGIDELLISSTPELNSLGAEDGFIYNLYTYKNGEIICAGYGVDRNRLYLCSDNSLYSFEYGGMSAQGYLLNELQGSSLITLESLSYDSIRDEDNPWFYDAEGDGSTVQIEESAANAIIERYQSMVTSFELTLFSDYTPVKGETEITGTDSASEEQIADYGSALDSGSAGSDSTWVFYDSGTLVVTGTGEIDSRSDNTLWTEYLNRIYSVVIEEGITKIGANNFMDCYNLSSVKIADSVTEISSGAFRNCSSLSSIDLPDGLVSIPMFTFSGCSFTSIEIPDSVTKIGSLAFYACDQLQFIEIPDGVTYIGSSAFADCSALTGAVVPESVTTLGDGNAVFLYCSKLTVIYYRGTQEQWDAISSEDASIAVRYNYTE